MPRLSQLVDTDYLPQPEEIPADIPRVYINGEQHKSASDKILNKLFGLNGEERYQLWPEKVIREGLSAAGDVYKEGTIQPGLRREDYTDIPAPDMPTKDSTWLGKQLGVAPVAASPVDPLVEKAQSISALAGTGGLGGVTDATLGATPFLRPALKYKDRLYKGKEGQSHQDVIPDALYPEFNKMAMSGEDISHYNFGFVNDKGQFLDREKALEYGINTGLIDPQAGKFGALTSTLMADSSKPGTAIEAIGKTTYPLAKPADRWTNTLGQNDHLIQNMTPDEFLNQSRPLKIDAESRENIDALKKHIQEGKQLDPLELGAKGKEDGRHRAIAAKELGIKEVPVINYREPADPFYSALEHNVSKISQSKMSGDQWLSTLSNKPGVKPEELDWTGLKSFLQENGKAPVTKDQIEEHLAANKVELKEVNKGGNNDPYLHYMRDSQIAHELKTPADIDLAKKHNANFRETFSGMSDREILKLAREAEATKDVGDTKYHSYQLPGGENYREMLLTLPKKVKDEVSPSPTASAKYMKEWDSLVAERQRLQPLVDDYNKRLTGEAWEKAKTDFGDVNKKMDILHNKMVEDTMKESPLKYGDPFYVKNHWDEPNILAHVRMNDRTIEGKKSLHLEEIQSDWHQQGRDKGYKDGSFPTVERDLSNARSNLENIMSDIRKEHNLISAENSLRQVNDRDLRAKMVEQRANAYNSSDKYKNALAEVKRLEEDVAKAAYGVPDAPFKKSWHELALKRMIREAAEKSYDRLSWTPGEAQAERYSLAKTLNKISYNPKQKYLKAWDHNGNEVMAKEGIAPENLADYVGKEGAQKLIEQPPKDFERIPSVKKEDLKVTQTEHQYIVTNKDKRGVKIGKGTVGSEAEALEYAERHLNRTAFEVNNNREIEYGRLGPTHILEGANLKVGGEGMKGFYDQIIPKALEKIGKEHGVKVKQAGIEAGGKVQQMREPAGWQALGPKNEFLGNFKTKEEAEAAIKQPIHYIDIPQSLKDIAMHKGFPLFSSMHMFIPVDHEPEFKKNATPKR